MIPRPSIKILEIFIRPKTAFISRFWLSEFDCYKNSIGNFIICIIIILYYIYIIYIIIFEYLLRYNVHCCSVRWVIFSLELPVSYDGNFLNDTSSQKWVTSYATMGVMSRFIQGAKYTDFTINLQSQLSILAL